jgi:hypothetical protein
MFGRVFVAGMGKNGTLEAARWQAWTAYVAEQLWAGRSPRQVVRELEGQGLGYETAVVLVATVEEELRRGGAL